MAIRIEVLDTKDGPVGNGAIKHDIELPAVPRIGEMIFFYDVDGEGERSVTVRNVLWLPQSGEAKVQVRAW